jgi:hypothetical protein
LHAPGYFDVVRVEPVDELRCELLEVGLRYLAPPLASFFGFRSRTLMFFFFAFGILTLLFWVDCCLCCITGTE